MSSLRGTKVDAAAVEALREANAVRANEKRVGGAQSILSVDRPRLVA